MYLFAARGPRVPRSCLPLSQTIYFCIVFLLLAPKLQFTVQKKYLKELIIVGFPCIYGYFGYCILQGASRYVLQSTSSESEVGLYFLGANIGKVIELPLWGFTQRLGAHFSIRRWLIPRKKPPAIQQDYELLSAWHGQPLLPYILFGKTDRAYWLRRLVLFSVDRGRLFGHRPSFVGILCDHLSGSHLLQENNHSSRTRAWSRRGVCDC